MLVQIAHKGHPLNRRVFSTTDKNERLVTKTGIYIKVPKGTLVTGYSSQAQNNQPNKTNTARANSGEGVETQ